MANTFKTEYACTRITKRVKIDHVNGYHPLQGIHRGDLEWSEPCKLVCPTPYALVLECWDSLHLFPDKGYQGVDPSKLEWDEGEGDSGSIKFTRLELGDGTAPGPEDMTEYQVGLRILYRATYILHVEARDYRCRSLNDRDIGLLNRKYLRDQEPTDTTTIPPKG